MKLSEFFSSGIMMKEAKLKVDIKLDDGEQMKKGEVVSILKDYGDGTYHAEQNDFACRVNKSEIEFLN